MVESGPSLSNGSGVGQHAAVTSSVLRRQEKNKGDLHSTVDFGEITVGDLLGRLEADTNLETGRTPVDELDSTLRLEGSNSGMSVLGHNISTVEQAGSHVLAVTRITPDHLVVGLEARHGNLIDRVGLVGGLVSRDNRSVGGKREVNTRVRDQIGLEFVQINVEGSIETQRGGDRRDNLGNETVKVLIAGALDSKVAAADVVDRLVVDHETAVRVFQGSVGSQDRVVWFHDRSRISGSGVDAEFQLGLLAIINGETLHQKGTETRTSTTTERVEDKETLETRAVVSHPAYLVKNLIDHLLSNGVVTASIVIRGILLASDHLLGVEEAAVCASADLIDNIGLEIAVDGSGDILSLTYITASQMMNEGEQRKV